MIKPFKVWTVDGEIGDVDVAEFAHKADAILFAQAKAKREGGFITGIMIGTSYETRVSVSLD